MGIRRIVQILKVSGGGVSPEGRGDDVVREDVPDDVQVDVHLVGACNFLSLTYPYR
jgi:hypothetical protein